MKVIRQLESKYRIINLALTYPFDIFFWTHFVSIFMIIRYTSAKHDRFQIQCFAKLLTIFIHTTCETQTTIARVDEYFNAIQDISFRAMCIECFLTRNLCIRMVVLYFIIINNNRKSTTNYFIVNDCDNLTFRKDFNQLLNLLTSPKYIATVRINTGKRLG